MTIPLDFQRMTEEEMEDRSRWLFSRLSRRRSVRHFSDEAIPLDVVRRVIHTAAQAPSGANKQPWTFALVTDPAIKRRLREAVEAEERAFYEERASREFLDDLGPMGTNASKPHLVEAPAVIVVFAQLRSPEGPHYYVKESVGIAVGMLLAGLHLCGLATLTHTPCRMDFLRELLGRPPHEKAFMILPVGYPAPGCEVPELRRKRLNQVLVEFEDGP